MSTWGANSFRMDGDPRRVKAGGGNGDVSATPDREAQCDSTVAGSSPGSLMEVETRPLCMAQTSSGDSAEAAISSLDQMVLKPTPSGRQRSGSAEGKPQINDDTAEKVLRNMRIMMDRQAKLRGSSEARFGAWSRGLPRDEDTSDVDQQALTLAGQANALNELQSQLDRITLEVESDKAALELKHQEEVERWRAQCLEFSQARVRCQEELRNTKKILLRKSAEEMEVVKAELLRRHIEELEAVRADLCRRHQEVLEAARADLHRGNEQADQAQRTSVEAKSSAGRAEQEHARLQASLAGDLRSTLQAKQATEESLRVAKSELEETVLRQRGLEDEIRALKQKSAAQTAAAVAAVAEAEQKLAEARSYGWFGCCSSVEKANVASLGPPPTSARRAK